jgi:hypothetical protein
MTGKEIGEARSDAATTWRDSDDEVVAGTCDAIARDATASCLAEVRASVGKFRLP